ncbi:TOBE domain-containing protein [Mesorhizobium sp. B2-4-16]|nr:TOBE domain-containing protein [Mesorhizobium sp. B2-4-16]
MTLADRGVLMKGGRVEQMGQPYEMYEQPNGHFSSTFLGRANVFAGAVENGTFAMKDLTLSVPLGTKDGKAEYIIRPEKIDFASNGGLIRGRTTARVFLGNHWLFQVETPLGVLHVTRANDAPPKASEGDEVGLVWALENVHIVPLEGKA